MLFLEVCNVVAMEQRQVLAMFRPKIWRRPTCVATLIIFILLSVKSLSWRMEHDTPLLHYAAYLMDKYNLIPYRDIFETSMPGAFGFHYLVGRLFGYGDLAFRIVDLGLLAGTMLATYFFMKRFGDTPAFFSSFLFGIFYLGLGQAMSLQRDYIALIPIAFSLTLIPDKNEIIASNWRFVILGLLFGLAALIKPHLAIGLPVIFWTLCQGGSKRHEDNRIDIVRFVFATLFGFICPLAIALIYLVNNGALSSFLDMVANYLPLHQGLTGGHEKLEASRHLRYLLKESLRMGGYGLLFLTAVYACAREIKCQVNAPARLSALSLLILVVASAAYAPIAGKFWSYHFLPLAYLLIISSSLLLTQRAVISRRTISYISLFNIAGLIVLTTTVFNPRRLTGILLRQDHAPKSGRVDEIAYQLASRLGPEDSVQALDWTAGSIHAMLLSKARLSTIFMYDYHFYHDTSSQYIQDLRHRFIRQIKEKKPRFIVSISDELKPSVRGIGTSRNFPELSSLISQMYKPVVLEKEYKIYEIKQ